MDKRPDPRPGNPGMDDITRRMTIKHHIDTWRLDQPFESNPVLDDLEYLMSRLELLEIENAELQGTLAALESQ